ncbi:MAG: hypothetical protein CBC42_00455 [Betaproteobacteria bacterium TMED82]|nr:MAG: hypothetical protein CBC42_00455 [Betaproteobacteria bacterium TMED82]|tara:strand:- start:20884 stop:21867 length:984 start_codon:yes stop_codon:yes gene_type:complete
MGFAKSLATFRKQMAKICLIIHQAISKSLTVWLVTFLSFPFLISCSQESGQTPGDSSSVKSEEIEPIGGIVMPESAFTMKDGRIIVSEIGEFNPTGKDGDGKIIEISLDGSKKVIADKGLNDPKGILVEGDTIFVTDNYEVKKVSFSGEVETWLSAKDFPRKPQFLNDITMDRNTMIYISDSGDISNGGGGAIFRVDSNRKVSVFVDAANDPNILSPNGLLSFQRGFLHFNDFANGFLFRVRLKDLVVEKLDEGFGGADGLVFSGTSLYLSDWKNGKIFKMDVSKVDGETIVLKEGMNGSADIDVTTDGKYLVIPEMKSNRVVFLPL